MFKTECTPSHPLRAAFRPMRFSISLVTNKEQKSSGPVGRSGLRPRCHGVPKGASDHGFACPSSEFLRQLASPMKGALAHLWLTLSGLRVVLHAAICDSLSFDPFAFEEDVLAAPEVDVGRGEIVDA